MNKPGVLPKAPRNEILAPNFDEFVNEVTMKLWNLLSAMPQFHHLEPKDYPQVYEALRKSLKPYMTLAAKPHPFPNA